MKFILKVVSLLSISTMTLFLSGCEITDHEIPDSVQAGDSFIAQLRLSGFGPFGGAVATVEDHILLCLSSFGFNTMENISYKIVTPDLKRSFGTFSSGIGEPTANDEATEKLKELKLWSSGLVTQCHRSKMEKFTNFSFGKVRANLKVGDESGKKDYLVLMGTPGNLELVGEFSIHVSSAE